MIQDSINKVRYAGSAIYFKNNDKYYLISARHVLEDTFSNFPLHVYSTIFLRPNGSELYDGKTIDNFPQDATSLEWVSEPSSGIYPFIFSPKNIDLVIVSLNDVPVYGQQFINTLNRYGYCPITIDDIDTIGKIKPDDQLTAIGFPDFSELRYKDIEKRNEYWQSWAVTIPAVTKGFVETLTEEYLIGNIFIYHGFSGGPVISRTNKLLGINSAYFTLTTNNGQPTMNRYKSQNSKFIRAKFIMPMLRELENRIKSKKVGG